MDTFFFKCGENDFECHDTFDSESEMTSNYKVLHRNAFNLNCPCKENPLVSKYVII